ncbi:hypothetical protein B0H16DRAFT_1855382 [Mycena metata]|uniref:WSC domain-containing protein n=1 Tax=Mycena metata TaxID=1033252 RepID=A0AAD7IM68_9AGAR|nr:hypothetical protein B0H16DRAFT_1855382 [Mycena metata]
MHAQFTADVAIQAADDGIPTIHADSSHPPTTLSHLDLNALFSLLVARLALSAAPLGKRQVYTTPTSAYTDSTTVCSTSTATVTSTDWYTITETPTPTYTETATVTDTETATVTCTETDSVTATETDLITTTETASVTATETTSVTATKTDSVTATKTDSVTVTKTDSVTVTKTTTTTAAAPSKTATWTFRGCYHDNITTRTLGALQRYGLGKNSVASCQAFCVNNGFTYAGVEDASQCFCASSILSGVTQGGTCNSACSGGVGTCGGVDAIDIYQATDVRTT